MKFCTFYNNPIKKLGTTIDFETVFVDQSEAERASLKFQLERFGQDTLLSKLKQTQSQFGYADTRFSKSFGDLAQNYAEANQYFQNLPAQIRAEYGHSAIRFYESIDKDPKQAFVKGYISKDLYQSLRPQDFVNEQTQKDIQNISDVNTPKTVVEGVKTVENVTSDGAT